MADAADFGRIMGYAEVNPVDPTAPLLPDCSGVDAVSYTQGPYEDLTVQMRARLRDMIARTISRVGSI